MRVVAAAPSLVFCLLFLAGCGQNPYLLQSQVQTLEQQRLALAQQSQDLGSRATLLDKDNQELETLLAQERQRNQVYNDQMAALREQLGGATAQITRLQEERDEVEKRSQTLMASTRRRAGATITANNSLLESLPTIGIAGVEVRRDGDVVRIETPGSQLFEEGTAQLKPQAGPLLESVAEELARVYPGNFIGVEGHMDNAPAGGGGVAAHHQLSTLRAMAVYDYLTARTRLRPNQLFVAGHGPNHPLVSNATPAGRQRNRRVELVVYPESVR